MARILIFSDIHSNAPALNAVLKDAGNWDRAICAGDVVGYYDQPNEACNTVRGLQNIHVIRGNHDAYVSGALTPDRNKARQYLTDWTANTLTQENSCWLQELPPEVVLNVGGWKITVRHATPWDEEGYIYPDSEDALEKISLSEYELMVLGHTHYPMLKNCGDGLLLNPGSVGQPRDRDPRASYAIFNTISGKVELKRVEYDVISYQKSLKQKRWSESIIRILSRTE